MHSVCLEDVCEVYEVREVCEVYEVCEVCEVYEVCEVCAGEFLGIRTKSVGKV